MVRHFSLDPEQILQIARVTRYGDLIPRNAVELELITELSLTTPQDFLAPDAMGWAIGQELRTAAERRVALWLAVVPESSLGHLRKVLGDEVVHVVGPPSCDVPSYLARHLRGAEPVVPIAISPSEFLQHLAKGTVAQQEYLRSVMTGSDTLNIASANRAALRDQQVEVIERPPIMRLLRHPKVWAYLVVFTYSALRVLPVMFVKHFHGRVWVLWTIDVVTAVPYTWGIIAMVTGSKIWIRVVGLVVAIITFTAPYIYFLTHGKKYPMYINVIVAALILGAVALEYYRWLRDRAVQRGLAESAN